MLLYLAIKKNCTIYYRIKFKHVSIIYLAETLNILAICNKDRKNHHKLIETK